MDNQLTSACRNFAAALRSADLSSSAHYEHGRIVGDTKRKAVVYTKGRTLLVVRRSMIDARQSTGCSGANHRASMHSLRHVYSVRRLCLDCIAQVQIEWTVEDRRQGKPWALIAWGFIIWWTVCHRLGDRVGQALAMRQAVGRGEGGGAPAFPIPRPVSVPIKCRT